MNPYYAPAHPALHGHVRNPYAMAYAPRRPYPLVGQAPPDTKPAEPSMIDKGKAFLGEENSLLKVKNGYILGAAVLVGLGIYGHSQRWF